MGSVKYTLTWEGPNRDFSRDTSDPLEVVDAFISFHKHEVGRLIDLPNFWDKLIIEKHPKETGKAKPDLMEEMPDLLVTGDYDRAVCLRAAMICRGKGETEMARALEKLAKRGES